MWARVATGAAALGLYGWRVEDPKGSYAAFFDFSDWITSFVLSDEGVWGYVRNMVNLVLIDQADGFLLGMAFFALLSILFWPFKAGSRWAVTKITGRGKQRHEAGNLRGAHDGEVTSPSAVRSARRYHRSRP